MSFCHSVSKKPSTSTDLDALQQRLGYTFGNPALLELAVTHKSFARENNERLEFIGDAVLGYVISFQLYRHHAAVQEDLLSLMRARLVRGSMLASVARELDLGPCLRVGTGERKSGGRDRASILADAFEAVIGAIHEDSGIDAVVGVVETLFAQRIRDLPVEDLKDAKTLLQEYLQQKKLPLPDYQVVATDGADHKRIYTVACRIDALGIASEASASSRRGAEKAAAERVLAQLPQEIGA